MELKGKIILINETKEYGANLFKKRELVLETSEDYPQKILIEFVQDKCEVLGSYKVNDNVIIGINLRGREWENPEGEIKYFNSIQGWKISKNTDQKNDTISNVNPVPPCNDTGDGLPFQLKAN